MPVWINRVLIAVQLVFADCWTSYASF